MSKDYVVVTTISTFVHKYVMHKDDLQKLNPDVDVDPITWAQDTVTCNDCDDFSQKHIGETIVDVDMISQKKMLKLFDKENDYLKNWNDEKKIEYVRKCLKP